MGHVFAARRRARALRVESGRGVFVVGTRAWSLADVVGVVLDLDESTIRHAGAADAASCRVALVLDEHVAKDRPRNSEGRRSQSTGVEQTVADAVLAAAAAKAIASTTILRTANPDEAKAAAAGLASHLGIPLVEV